MDQERIDDQQDYPPRRCALPDCPRDLPIGSSPRRRYCCDAHKSLASYRRRSERSAAIAQQLSALHTGVICPVDGRVFAVERFARRCGRPRKYDCDGCREIARQLRLLDGGR